METKLKVVLGTFGGVFILCAGCCGVNIIRSSDDSDTPKKSVVVTQSVLPLLDLNSVSPVPIDSPSETPLVSLSPTDAPVIIAPKTEAPPPPQKTEDEEEDIQTGVTPGAFCSHAGAIGRAKNGNLYTCKKSSTDNRLRWRR